MDFKSRKPTQQLTIYCKDCGNSVVRFESFVAEGSVFEKVGQKLSELMAFVTASPEAVRCSLCIARLASENQNRRLVERDRLRQQMELPPAPLNSLEQPATFVPSNSADRDKKEDGLRSFLRRGNSRRDKTPATRYSPSLGIVLML
jgi:hypothetical protein